MISFEIKLPLNEILHFTSITNKIMTKVELTLGNRTVNAKSILGIHSIDFNNPVLILSFSENASDMDKFYIKEIKDKWRI